MCGRSRVTMNRQQVAAAARTAPERWRNADSFQPSYNLSPGHDAPVVLPGAVGERDVQTMRWGLVPSWTKKGTKPDHFRMFNARSETVQEKSVFSRLLSSQRCIFMCEGFYEWKKDGSKKQPYYISFGEDSVMHMAALYDVWHTGEDGEVLGTFTILTTDSSKRLQWLHNRMPVLLPTLEAQDAWLGDTMDFKILNQLVTPFNGEELVWHEVTPEMGKVSFQGPSCCKPMKKVAGITAFFKSPGAGGKTGGKPGETASSTSAVQPAGKGGKAAEAAEEAAPSADVHSAGNDAAVKVEVKAEPGGQSPAAPSSQPDAAASRPAGEQCTPDTGPALPLNPDDNPAAVKQEQQTEEQGSQPSSQQGAGLGSQQDSSAQAGQKRSKPGSSPASRSPAAKRAKHEAQPPAKGQKTMQTFFAAK